MKVENLKRVATVSVLAYLLACCPQAGSDPLNHLPATNAAALSVKNTGRLQSAEFGGTPKIDAPVPFQFEENRGQADPSVQFISRGAGYTLFLTANEAVFVFTHQKPATSGLAQRSPYSQLAEKGGLKSSSVLRMKLSGSNAVPQAKGTTRLAGTVNYFVGSDATQWHTGIATYSEVVYGGVYPGIDIHYYGNHRQLEYDFVLNPGADAKNIALGFEGTKGLALDSTGNIRIQTETGELTLSKPLIYQMVDAEKKLVQGAYVLRQGQTVGIELGNYDPKKALVVDPVLIYSSYLGGSGNEFAEGVATDSLGNVYVAGATSSADFPNATNSISPAPSGHCVAFVSKLDPTGGTVLYSSYIGGTSGDSVCNRGDFANGIAVDALGQVYVAGPTLSRDFPVTSSAFQPSLGAGASSSAFLSKLSADGGSLLYSSYLGGTGNDGAYSLTVDQAQNAYMAGWAGSADFPITPNAFQTAKLSTSGDGFISRIDTTKAGANSLVYSTFLGGSGPSGDAVASIAIDSAQNLYVTGWTSSTDFPITPASAFQPTASISNFCAFVSRFDTSKSGSGSLLYGSFLCGTHDDWPWRIALDPNSNVYVTGYAASSDFPTTVGGPNNQFGEAFVTKVDTNLSGSSSLVYSRLLGGSNSLGSTDQVGNSGTALAVDSNGNAYVGGSTLCTDFPVTSDAIQTTLRSASGNGFLTAISPDGSSILYSTYFGGSGTGRYGDQVYDLKLDANSDIYIAGQTDSTDLPTTSGALQPSLDGPTDAFVAKLTALAGPHILSIAPIAGPPGTLVTISGSGFGTVTGSVTIGGMAASVQSWSPDAIVVQVPSLLNDGYAQVDVTTSRETSNSGHFSVETAIISRLSRTSGPIGARVKIFGSGFGPLQGSSRVTFNGVPAFVISWSESSIEVLVPRGATTGIIMVRVGGVSSNSFNFKVVGGNSDKDCNRDMDCCDRGCVPEHHFLN